MRGLSHTLGKMFGKAELSVDWRSSPLADDISSDINSPGISHLLSQLISDGEHLYLTNFVYAHHYLLSVYLLQDIHHPLADDVSGLAHPTYFIARFWWWIFNFWHHVTYFAYAHYYLLSVYLLQDAQTVSHSWQDISKAELSFDVHHPRADNISGDVNSRDITYLWWWTFIFLHISPILQLLMPITIFFYLICLCIAGCISHS